MGHWKMGIVRPLFLTVATSPIGEKPARTLLSIPRGPHTPHSHFPFVVAAPFLPGAAGEEGTVYLNLAPY